VIFINVDFMLPNNCVGQNHLVNCQPLV